MLFIENINLNFVRGLSGLQSVRSKSVIIFEDREAVYNTNTVYSAPSNVSVQEGETIVLEYTFDSNISFDNAIRRQKYYATTYLQEIQANRPIDFRFNNIATATHGKATLRMSIGRQHEVSKSPVITFNSSHFPRQ